MSAAQLVHPGGSSRSKPAAYSFRQARRRPGDDRLHVLFATVMAAPD